MLCDDSHVLTPKRCRTCQLLFVISTNFVLRTRVMNWKDLTKFVLKQFPQWSKVISQASGLCSSSWT